MERTYRFKNGIIVVTLPESCDQEELKKVAKEFLKKAMSGGYKSGNSNSSRNFREK